MSTTNDPDDIPLLHDGMHYCDDCVQIVHMSASRERELLERDDATYCPRCGREHMDATDHDLRWGRELSLLDEIRKDRTLALKYTPPGCPPCYIVHREDYIYERWMRCEDDEQNYTTISEAAVVTAMKRASFTNYVSDPPKTVRIVNAPINADHPETGAVPMSYERV